MFVGANQPKVTIEFASMLQRLGTRAQDIRISGSGKNALDFHVAFYVGELAAKEPGTFFHIVSGDGGFVPLLNYLKSRGIFARQWKDLAEIPHIKAAGSKSLPDKIAFVVENLRSRAAGRPSTVKTLSSTVGSLFPGGLAEEERASLLSALESKGVVAIAGNRVTYPAGS